jgi:Arc/MetJ-type ribon-helix-helix transcriptional regulator
MAGMNVELSERARQRVENLVRDGAYPSVEAAVDAAVAKLEHPNFDGIDLPAIHAQLDADVAAGRVHEYTPEFRAEMRRKLEALIQARQSR